MPETETNGRERFTLKATTTVGTDEGTFDAVISTGAVDREKDVVEPDAMVKALRKWLEVGKLVPLDWNHSTEPADQIGHIKPDTVKAVDGEVLASGWIDQSTEVGEHAWRLVKAGTLGFSFFAMIPEGGAAKRKGGGLHITELDVVAVTVTPTPMNPGTRVVAWKAADAEAVVPVLEQPPSEAQLQKQDQEQRLGEATKDVPKDTPAAPDPVEQLAGRVDSLSEQFETLKTELGEQLKGIKAAVEEPNRANSAKHDPLRMRADQAVLDIQSDGISSRKSPPTRQDPTPEPLDESDLRARSRRTMLELLTGVPNDTE